MRKNMPYMVLDITKKPGDPNAVKTGDMLLAENERLRKALSSIAENLRIHLQLPAQTISMNRREVERMINDCEKPQDATRGAPTPETATGKSSCEDLLASALARVVEHAHGLDGDTTWTHAIRGEDYDFARLVLSETGKQ